MDDERNPETDNCIICNAPIELIPLYVLAETGQPICGQDLDIMTGKAPSREFAGSIETGFGSMLVRAEG